MNTQTSGRQINIFILIYFLVLSLLAIDSLIGNAYAQAPIYQKQFSDAITGDNQFWSQSKGAFRWYINQSPGADGSSGTLKPDSYQNDQYERPTDPAVSG